MGFIKKLWILCFIVFCISCYIDDGIDHSLLAKKELTFQNETAAPPPDFSSPTIEDPSCVVENMPEPVKWLTSKPKDLGALETTMGGTFRTIISEYPQTFRYLGPDANNVTKTLIWNTASLLSINPETQEFMPLSATHWAFGADGRTVYFKLHEQLRWSDGVRCTADDFLFNIEFMRSPYLQDPWYTAYAEQFEVEKINDYCFSIKTITPMALPQSTLLDLVNITPKPKHFYNGAITEDWYIKYDKTPEPTTAAYAINLNKCIEGEKLVFERVPNWWARSYDYLKKTANIETIEYYVLNPDESREKLFYAGDLEMIAIDPKLAWENCNLITPVKNGYITKYIFNFVPLTGIMGICFNTEAGIFRSKKIRQAMYYALDIQGMIDSALQGEYIRYHNIGIGQVWGGIDFNDHSIKKPAYDFRTARKMFNEEGYIYTDDDGILKNAKGERLSFSLLYPTKTATVQLVYLKQKAKEAGVEMRLEHNPNYIDRLLSDDFEAAGEEFTTWFIPEYNQFFSSESYFDKQSLNIWNYRSDEMDALLNSSGDTASLEQLAENNKKIERLVDEEALVVPTYISNFTRLLAWRWLRFPAWGNRKHISDDFNPYGYMWIDEEIKIELQGAMKKNQVLDTKEYALSKRYLN